MLNWKSFLVTEPERKYGRRHVRFQQHEDAKYHEYFPLQSKTPKEIHAILIEKLGERAPLYATDKNCVTQFKRGDFSNCDVRHVLHYTKQ